MDPDFSNFSLKSAPWSTSHNEHTYLPPQLIDLNLNKFPNSPPLPNGTNQDHSYQKLDAISSIAKQIQKLKTKASIEPHISPQKSDKKPLDSLWKELKHNTKEVIFLTLEAYENYLKGNLGFSIDELLLGKVATLPFNPLSKETDKFRNCDIQPSLDTLVTINDSYIHANYVGKDLIDRQFIASQAPLARDFDLFWNVALEKTDLILDLTNQQDKNRCDDIDICYPNQQNPKLESQGISVTFVMKEDFESAAVYTYSVKNKDKEKLIKRFHFTEWPDHGIIPIEILNQLVNLLRRSKTPIAIVHCRAGVGRSGTTIIAAILKELIVKKKINNQNLESGLLEICLKVREQRDVNVLTKPAQLELLLNYGTWLLENRSRTALDHFA